MGHRGSQEKALSLELGFFSFFPQELRYKHGRLYSLEESLSGDLVSPFFTNCSLVGEKKCSGLETAKRKMDLNSYICWFQVQSKQVQ